MQERPITGTSIYFAKSFIILFATHVHVEVKYIPIPRFANVISRLQIDTKRRCAAFTLKLYLTACTIMRKRQQHFCMHSDFQTMISH